MCIQQMYTWQQMYNVYTWQQMLSLICCDYKTDYLRRQVKSQNLLVFELFWNVYVTEYVGFHPNLCQKFF